MFAPLVALALQSATPAPPAPPEAPAGAMRGLVSIFDMVCNRVFPDDARIAAAMTRIPNTRALTPAEVRVYLKDDPGRGWVAQSGPSRIVITVEAPPIHACAVRMERTDGAIDEAMWHQVVDAAKTRSGGGFTAMPKQAFTIGDVRSTVIGEQKQNPDGSAEAFYLFRTAPVDPAKAPGYGVELRLVHQIVGAGARR